jgi:high-affinity Fe2+/Pb2+ permease
MSRLIVSVAVILVVVVGGLFLLAGRSGERPVTQVEKQVVLANLQ